MTDFFGGVARVEVAPAPGAEASSEKEGAGWAPEQPSERQPATSSRPFKALPDRPSAKGMAHEPAGYRALSTVLGGAVLLGAASFVYTHTQ